MNMQDCKSIALLEGSFKNIDVEIALVVFDRNVGNKGQHLATFELKYNGESILLAKGVVFGLMNKKTPTFFRIKAGQANGAVDILKMYKSNDTFEGKYYHPRISIAMKKAFQTQNKNKERIRDMRHDEGVGFNLKINRKLSLVDIPDNEISKTIERGISL